MFPILDTKKPTVFYLTTASTIIYMIKVLLFQKENIYIPSSTYNYLKGGKYTHMHSKIISCINTFVFMIILLFPNAFL